MGRALALAGSGYVNLPTPGVTQPILIGGKDGERKDFVKVLMIAIKT